MPVYIDGHRTSFQGCACRDGVIHLNTGANQLAAAGSSVNHPEAPAAPGPAFRDLAGPGLPSGPESEPEATAPGPSQLALALPETTGHASSSDAIREYDNGKCPFAFSCSSFNCFN